jgi:hypothetical protein
MRRHLSCLILCILVSACASGRAPLIAPLDTSFTLHINQPYAELPNGTHIDFQHGVRVPQGNLDRWTTYCRLYVYNRIRNADYHSEVSVGEIEISAVTMAYQSSDNLGHPWGLYNSLSLGLRDPPSYYLYRVSMRLTSPEQPDIQSLNCYKKWSTAGAEQYPTLPEIRQALGRLMELVPTSGG